MSEKEPESVTQIKRRVKYGEITCLFCDSEYNHVSFRTMMNTWLKSDDLNEENYNEGFIQEKMFQLDNRLLDEDCRIRCMILIWVSESGEKIICKMGDYINVYETFFGWEKYETQQLLFFSSRSATDMYLGSGICLPLTARIQKGVFIYLLSENTIDKIDQVAGEGSSQKFLTDIYDSKSPDLKMHYLDINEFAEQLDKGRVDLVMNEFVKKYFSKKSSRSQFFAILD
ncbi:hypothetical protein [Vibrio sp. D431a]|uniref:hypothetical protein n=1 Tax=Vibrio sp. D431a TaxID=2837388 RepID=UPI002553F53E|nr:hypothetical protein [Vibrio sp. D431a]MDK9793896.1 hypothetical protein [Vibrio sp. D431a]